MAKRKNSVALFEVIKAQKSREEKAAAASAPETAQPGALRTPKWWFKRAPGRRRSNRSPAPTRSPPPPCRRPPRRRRPRRGDRVSTRPTWTRRCRASAAALVQRVVPAASPERVTIPGGVDPFGLDPSPRQSSPVRRTAAVVVRLRPGQEDRHRPRPQGSHRPPALHPGDHRRLRGVRGDRPGLRVRPLEQPRPAGANGITSEQVRRGPILAGVLDVQAERTTLTEEGAEAPAPEAPNNVRVDPPPAEPVSTGNDAPRGGGPTEGTVVNNPAPEGVTDELPRHNGLNYIVIQSYPERKDAEAAKEALLAAGIPCTVQRPPSGWDQKLWAVIGTYGFPRTNTMPQYNQYMQRIKAVSKTFAGKSKYRSFDPLAGEVEGFVSAGVTRASRPCVEHQVETAAAMPRPFRFHTTGTGGTPVSRRYDWSSLPRPFSAPSAFRSASAQSASPPAPSAAASGPAAGLRA